MSRTEVVIAGGGPVGMTLAYVLAHFGVRSVLVERNPATTSHPKMDITNARSMELFARVGLADRLRAVAIAETQPFDVSWVTTMTGYELHRFPYPGAGGVRDTMHRKNDGTQPSQPPMRVSQVVIEPVLRQAIEEHPLVDVRFGTNFEDFTQTGEGVTVCVTTATGEIEEITCAWLVGCDGGTSHVRELLGIPLQGRARISQRFITHFRSDARDLLQRWGPAWHYQSNQGTLVAQNDHDIWTLLSRLPEGIAPGDINPSDLIEAFVGAPIKHEVLVSNAWSPHLLVADSFGRDRVMLAGDSVHQYIPTGGYGMNTGIGDAVDLGWKLAAVLRGFGGLGLIDSYEAERRPVALANCAGSSRHNDIRVAIAALYTPGLGASGPVGDAARAKAAKRIAELGNAENECVGLEMGYVYSSGIVTGDGEPAAADPLIYLPSTRPGARLPSVYLADSSNLHDHLGTWFTLLCFDPVPTDAFEDAARDLGIPLAVRNIDAAGHRGLFAESILLVRPDMHIAWAGNTADEEQAHSLLLRATGNGNRIAGRPATPPAQPAVA